MGANNCCFRSKDGEERFQQNPKTYQIENPQLPLKSNVINQSKAIPSLEDEEWGVQRKEGSSKALKAINNSRQKFVNGKFFIKILIETVSISYKLCDDFGLFFKPLIQVQIDKQSIQITSCEDDKLNISENSDINNLSFNNIVNNINNNNKEHRRSAETVILPREKYFYFKDEIEICLNDKSFFSFLKIKLINNNSHSKLKLKGIDMAEVKFPLNLIFPDNENYFDGYFPLKFKGIDEIGQIKLKIHLSEKKQKINGLNSLIDEESTDYSFSEPKGLQYIDNIVFNYHHFDDNTLDKYFFNENTRKIKDVQIFFALEFINEKVFRVDCLLKYFLISLKQENYVLIYEILNKLIYICNQNDFDLVLKFYNSLQNEIYEDFIKICEFTNYNAFITKHFLNFIFYYAKSIKKNEKNIISNLIYQNFIQIIYDIIKKISEVMKTTPESNYQEEIRECIQLGISIFNEYISINKTKVNEMSEYTVIYNNAITIFSYRIILIRLIEQFIEDSQIQSNLFRLFRKMTIIITNHDSVLLDRTRIKGSPMDISKQFKTLMIEKYDGLFFKCLNLVLYKYQHYPQLHYNILLIIYHIINDSDSEGLKNAVNRLGLKSFEETFRLYRGKLKAISKLLNKLYLNILAIFSEIKSDNNDHLSIKIDLSNILNNYYKENKSNKNLISDFKKAKNTEIEIHLIITKIFSNLTRLNEVSDLFLKEEKVVEDLIDYLKNLNSNKMIEDFLNKFNEKEKKNNLELTKKTLLNVVENTCQGIKNVLSVNQSSDSLKYYMKYVEEKFKSKENFLNIFEKCKNGLEKYSLVSKKMNNNIQEINEKIHEFWNQKEKIV